MLSSFDNSNWRNYISTIVNAQVVICAAFLICALYLAKNNYTGFDGVFTGLLFAFFIYLTNKGIVFEVNHVYYGAILGGTCVLLILSLQQAIFYGQYGSCIGGVYTAVPSSYPTLVPTTLSPTSARRNLIEKIVYSVLDESSHISRSLRTTIGVECYHKAGMKAICAFSVFMFLTYIAQLFVLIQCKNEILASSPSTDYGAVPSSDYVWKKVTTTSLTCLLTHLLTYSLTYSG